MQIFDQSSANLDGENNDLPEDYSLVKRSEAHRLEKEMFDEDSYVIIDRDEL